MTTIIAHITVREGAERDFEQIARDLFVSTHGAENGVRAYEYWRGEAPRSYYTLLAFDDHRAFITHQTSDHHEDASPRIGHTIESLRLEFVDPVDGASPLPPTRHQPALPDADDLTRTYTERFAAKEADWWATLR